MKKPPRIAICIDSRERSGRERLRGVCDFAQPLGWHLHLVRTENAATLRFLAREEFDGAIFFDRSSKMHGTLRRRKVICVEASDRNLSLDDAAVFVDTKKVMTLAFEHFQTAGYSHYAYCGISASRPSEKRRSTFASVAEAHGAVAHNFSDTWSEGEAELRGLADWLKRLPRPIGVVTFDDKMAERVLAACRRVGIKVPEDVGVLGIGDDELLCEFTVPRLSSITVPLQEIGRQAAAALELLLRGRKMPRRQIPIAPIDIAMRGSTERLGTSSHPVLAAVQYIKSTSGRSVGTGDVADAVGMPRRTMERRFKRELGITVHDWIIREKLSRARELLKRSWTPVTEVAQRCGYSSQSAFVRMFTQGTGMHPLKFRSLNRG